MRVTRGVRDFTMRLTFHFKGDEPHYNTEFVGLTTLARTIVG
jgi:hypothetical protein